MMLKITVLAPVMHRTHENRESLPDDDVSSETKPRFETNFNCDHYLQQKTVEQMKIHLFCDFIHFVSIRMHIENLS